MSQAHLIDDVDTLTFDRYWDIIKYNAQVFSPQKLWMEFLTQWFILIATIALSILFLKSILNLKRTQQGIDFD